MAMWVVVGHWATTAPLPRGISSTKLYNAYAVDVFVMLSGLAITILLLKRNEGYRRYITRRALRIFPVYLFYFALSVLTIRFALETWMLIPDQGFMNDRRVEISENSMTYAIPHVLAHVVALHGLIPDRILPDSEFAFLGQAWSISLEWQFYLLAPLLIGSLIRPTKAKIILAGIVTFVLLIVAFAGSMPNGFLGRHIPGFLIGILTAILLTRGEVSGTRPRAAVVTASVILGAMLSLGIVLTDRLIPYAIWYWVIWAIIFRERIAMAGGICRFLTSPATRFLGDMSYSLYLCHMLVIVLLSRLLVDAGMFDSAGGAALLLVLTIGISIGLARLTYVFVEQPGQRLGRSLSRPDMARP